MPMPRQLRGNQRGRGVSRGGGGGHGREDGWPASMRARRRQNKAPEVPLNGSAKATHNEMMKYTLPLLKEFCHNVDYTEAIQEIGEKFSSGTIGKFVEIVIEHGLEHSEKSRSLCGNLLAQLVKKRMVTEKQYVEGLNGVLSIAEDLLVDIPKFWDYMAHIVAPVLSSGSLGLSILKESASTANLCSGELGKRCAAGKYAAAVLHEMGKSGQSVVAKLWRDSGLKWSNFLSVDTSEDEFLLHNKLVWTVAVGNSSVNVGELTNERIGREIAKVLETGVIKKETDIFKDGEIKGESKIAEDSKNKQEVQIVEHDSRLETGPDITFFKLSNLLNKKSELERVVNGERDHFVTHKQDVEDTIDTKSAEMKNLILMIEKSEDEKSGRLKKIVKVDNEIMVLQIKKTDLLKENDRDDERIKKIESKKHKLESYIEKELIKFKEEGNDIEDKIKDLEKQLSDINNAIKECPSEPLTTHIAQAKMEPHRQILEFIDNQIREKENELECPVCLEVAAAPIFMCSELHLICSNCRPKVKACPECRMTYDGKPKRHRYAEKAAEELVSIRNQRIRMLTSST